MIKLAELLSEVESLDKGMQKSAAAKRSNSPFNALAANIDKLAEMLDEETKKEEEKEEGKEDEKKDEDEKEEEKEASMKLSNADLNKIANMVMKMAVGGVQGSVVNEGPSSADGKLTNDARGTDQIVTPPTADTQVPEGADLIKDKAPRASDEVAGPLQGGEKGASVVYTAKEAAVLQKLAGVGYEYLVDYHSDQLVRQKVAEAITAEKAKDAPIKIARALLQKQAEGEKAPPPQGGGSDPLAMIAEMAKAGLPGAAELLQALQQQMGGGGGAPAPQGPPPKAASVSQKLATIQQKDPILYSALKVLADRKLI